MRALPYKVTLPQESAKAQTLGVLARYVVPDDWEITCVRTRVERSFWMRPVGLGGLAEQHSLCDIEVRTPEDLAMFANTPWWDEMLLWSPPGHTVQFVILTHGGGD